MKNKALISLLLAGAVSIPASAAAPPFETPARIAFLKDLSSGAVLFDKGADQRMPPASMAKRMSVDVAFELIDKGDLKLDKICTVRPETWQKWHGPEAGSTMFLSPGEQVSVQNLLHGIVTPFRQRRHRRACRVHFRDRARLRRGDERRGQEARPQGQPFRQSGRLARRRGDLCHRARSGDARHGDDRAPSKLYKQFYSRPNLPGAAPWAATSRSPRAIAIPILGHIAGADGPQDRPYRRGRLRLHRFGDPERAAGW